MTPEQLLYLVQNPHNYTGQEINRSGNSFSPNKINVCLVFPDTYEIGMSHQGIKLLYQLLNSLPQVNAERCFLPDPQSLPLFKSNHVPLFSLESRTQLASFDLIAFSLLSELSFTNLLAVLDLANIPLHSTDRSQFPLVAAGGISAINPEPLRQFIDFFAFGDGEILFPEIIDTVSRCKELENRKDRCLQELDQLEGFYVPKFYPTAAQGPFFVPDTKGRIIKKRYLRNIDKQEPLSTSAIVPLGQVVFDRLDIEVARGCPNSCHFCQARNYYAPFRYKNGDMVLRQIENTLKKTGFDTLSLASLSTGDHPDLPDILSKIDAVLPPCTAFSFPSLRPRTLSDQMLKTLSKYRRTGLTIVPEAGSERLRRIIGKEVTDAEILTAVGNAIQNGWQKIKLYFMIGLPTENDDDILAIAELIKAILKQAQSLKSKIDLTLSFSTFVPKPHTPFQWSSRLDSMEAKRRLNLIKSQLNLSKFIKFDFHSLEKGMVETIISRGDQRVGTFLYEAYQAGEIFTAWDFSFHPEIWLDLIHKHQLAFLLKEISCETQLPWSFIEINQAQTILKREYLKAITATDNPGYCSKGCQACGLCLSFQDQISPTPPLPNPPILPSAAEPAPPEAPSFRIRLFYEKRGDFRFFPHLTMQKYLERIIRISMIPFRFSEGFHPRIKMAMLPPLPVFAESFHECIELSLSGDMSPQAILDKLNQVDCPLKFFRALKLDDQSPSLMKDLREMTFSFSGPVNPESLVALSIELQSVDSFNYQKDLLTWHVGCKQDIAAQFGKTYKIIDPERRHTRYLSRIALSFHSETGMESGV